MKSKHPENNNLVQHYQARKKSMFSVMWQKLNITYETDGKEKLVLPLADIKLYSKHCSSLADGL